MIRLIVDSTFGLSKEYAKENNIEVVSLSLNLGDKTYIEKDPSTWDKFFEDFEHGKDFPQTSQPSPAEFEKAIKNIYKKEPNAEIIILTIASLLSGTVNSARLASKSFKGKKIEVLDSLQATVGSKVLLEKLVDEINNGKTFEQVVSLVEALQDKIDLYFVPSTMEYLKRGGRIGTLSAAIASVLSIKPIFKFKNGKVTIKKKVLGLSKAIHDMVGFVQKPLEKIYVCYIHSKEHVDQIVQKVKSTFGINSVEIMPVSPVFGAHVGIGAVGIATLSK